MRATRAIIHLDTFSRNFRVIQELTGPDRRICIPVKADAYGHGAVQIARAGLQAGAFCLAVATVEEGTELRAGGITAPITLLSQALPEEIPGILANQLCPLVSDPDFAGILDREAAAAGLKLQVHLKIDTGMGRMGCSPAESPDIARKIVQSKALEYAGTATHLAVSDSAAPDDIAYTQGQLALFRKALDAIRAAGFDPGIVHAANSGAVVLHPDSWFDMIRPGILLYGYNPVPQAGSSLKVEPVMELRSTIVLIKKVKKGETLSYGRTWTAPRDTAVAVLSVGYADGLPRLASNKWQVFCRGNSYPLVGRICMDQCLVDLGPEPDCSRWDEVTVFGSSVPDAAALAERIGTIPYEITCNINKRVPRVYSSF